MTNTTTLNFDDIDTSPYGIAQISNGYGALDWSNFFALDVTHNPEGYAASATSGQQVALNGGGGQAGVGLSDGTFTFKSVEMTAAYDSKLKVDIYGYHDGTEVFHRTVMLNDTTPRLVRLNFVGVDDVEFVPGAGKHDPAKSGFGSQIGFDDMTIGKIVHDANAPIHSSFGDANHLAAMHPEPLMATLHIA